MTAAGESKRDTARIMGSFLLIGGFGIALLGAGETKHVSSYVLAALLVLSGIGLRIEAAIRERSRD
jgi:hypothetical protein